MKGKVSTSLVIFALIVLAVVSIVMVTTYNGIVRADKRVEEATGDIQSVCQRRLDLVPNLVETVKGYAQHERQTLIAVTEARNSAQKALSKLSKGDKGSIAALESSQSELMRVLKNLFALAENYPDLKASSNFLALQDQLEGTENRINVARQRYNYAAQVYNTRIAIFPGIIIAGPFGFEEKAYFEAKEAAMEPVEVEF